mgnify:CR=1 FL=1
MVIILNFGSQFAHLIARRVRDLGAKAEILPFDTPTSEIQKYNPTGIILSGGPASVLEKGSPRPDKEIFKLDIPVLGICYGHQVMAHMLGGKVAKGKLREFGKEILSIKDKKGIFQGFLQKRWFGFHTETKYPYYQRDVNKQHLLLAANMPLLPIQKTTFSASSFIQK